MRGSSEKLARWAGIGMPFLLPALIGCGNASNDRPDEGEAPSFEAVQLPPPAEDQRSGDLTMDRLTGEYLAGTWCFARPGGAGERGSYVFEPDGSHRATVAGFVQEMSGDLETFRERYEQLVEMDPDRFVVKDGAYEYEFRRGPCP